MKSPTLATSFTSALSLFTITPLLFQPIKAETNPPLSNPSMNAPSFKLLSQRNTTVSVKENGTYLQILILRDRNDSPVRYVDIQIRVYDEKGLEIAVKKAYAPQEIYISVGNNSQGDYVLALKKGQRVASVELSRSGDKQTFAVAENETGTSPKKR